jgi:ATP-dependent Clp protease adapter protein ClpS
MRDLPRAPWANQEVSRSVRACAWLFVFCGGLALSLTTYSLIVEGVKARQVWLVVLAYAGIGYFLWLFGYAAIRGRGPAGWWPLQRTASAAVSPVFPPDTCLLSLDGFVPDGFVTGIEILNDSTTPMEFVAGVLMKHFEYSREHAMTVMLEIHERGGLLIPLPSSERAALVATLIGSEAREHSHALVCRAVSVAR